MFRSREQMLALGGAVLVALLLAVLPPVRSALERLELSLYDERMEAVALRPDDRIRVFGVDEDSVRATDGWSGAAVDGVLGLLASGGASGVYLQMAPAGPLGEGASALGPRLLAEVGRGSATVVAPTPLEPEPDGRVRRVRLGAPDPAGRLGPTGPLALYANLRGVDPKEIRFEPDHVQVGAQRIPTDAQHRVWVHFQPMLSGTTMVGMVLPFEPISVTKLLDPESPVRTRLEGAAVLIGNTGDSAMDEVPTGPGVMRRVLLDANVLDGLLAGFHLRRPGPGAQALVLLGLTLALALTMPRMRLWPGLATAAFVLVGYYVLNGWLFARGLWLDLGAPEVGGLAVVGLCLALLLARSSRLLGQFLAPEVARRVMADAEQAALGGQEKVCTILFYSLPPYLKKEAADGTDLQLRRRNEFTSMASEILVRHGGRVMDYQGDAQMVLFGAPRDLPNHAASASAAALEIQERSRDMTGRWGLEDPADARIHAGLCTGPLAVGFVGSEGHKEFAAIGDTTNVAARLYVAAMKMGVPVLVAGSTYDAAGGALEAEALPPVELKGKSQPVPVYRAVAVRGEAAPA